MLNFKFYLDDIEKSLSNQNFSKALRRCDHLFNKFEHDYPRIDIDQLFLETQQEKNHPFRKEILSLFFYETLCLLETAPAHLPEEMDPPERIQVVLQPLFYALTNHTVEETLQDRITRNFRVAFYLQTLKQYTLANIYYERVANLCKAIPNKDNALKFMNAYALDHNDCLTASAPRHLWDLMGSSVHAMKNYYEHNKDALDRQPLPYPQIIALLLYRCTQEISPSQNAQQQFLAVKALQNTVRQCTNLEQVSDIMRCAISEICYMQYHFATPDALIMKELCTLFDMAQQYMPLLQQRTSSPDTTEPAEEPAALPTLPTPAPQRSDQFFSQLPFFRPEMHLPPPTEVSESEIARPDTPFAMMTGGR